MVLQEYNSKTLWPLRGKLLSPRKSEGYHKVRITKRHRQFVNTPDSYSAPGTGYAEVFSRFPSVPPAEIRNGALKLATTTFFLAISSSLFIMTFLFDAI